jgi:hypothetical protein
MYLCCLKSLSLTFPISLLLALQENSCLYELERNTLMGKTYIIISSYLVTFSSQKDLEYSQSYLNVCGSVNSVISGTLFKLLI